MRGDENDGDSHAALRQAVLKIEPAHLRQPDVENQAAWAGDLFGAEKLLTSCKGFSAKADRLYEIVDCLTHTAVIIDDEDRGSGREFHASAPALTGRVK